MKIVGLITEYNPFHNGHLYHIRESLRITGADAALVVMSGDYVQRGTPAIMPKRLRTEMALYCGAGAVLELPVCYATGSAEFFALGAISLLDSLGIVDSVCFGSECSDLPLLQKIAGLLVDEPEQYREILRHELKLGKSFPAARQTAVVFCTGDPRCADILKDPNNILGIEYLKAIRSLLAYSSSSIHTEFAGDDSTELSFSDILNELGNQVPKKCLELLSDFHKIQYPVYQNDFSLILKYKLLNKHPESLVRYMDVSPELAARICTSLNDFFNYKQFAGLLKTKELTQTRINRALLHIMLGIKKDSVSEYMNSGYNFYARLLGFRKDCSQILTEISKKSSLPLLTKLAESRELCELGQRMLRDDILASNLYTSVVTDKFKTAFLNEYKQRIIKI